MRTTPCRCLDQQCTAFSAGMRQGRRQLNVTAMAQKKQKLMWEALREAIDEEMEKDPAVCVMGESQRYCQLRQGGESRVIAAAPASIVQLQHG